MREQAGGGRHVAGLGSPTSEVGEPAVCVSSAPGFVRKEFTDSAAHLMLQTDRDHLRTRPRGDGDQPSWAHSVVAVHSPFDSQRPRKRTLEVWV